jgi:Zn-finger protein
MEQVEIAKVEKVFDRKIWIEDGIMGDKHVMIQHQDGESEPFCYCSFYYDYAYTSNSAIRDAAEKMAEALGGKSPIEYKTRPFNLGA